VRRHHPLETQLPTGRKLVCADDDSRPLLAKVVRDTFTRNTSPADTLAWSDFDDCYDIFMIVILSFTSTRLHLSANQALPGRSFLARGPP
jgi:hypothetical protein